MLVLRVLPSDLEVQNWGQEDSALDLIFDKYGYPRYLNRILYEVFQRNDKMLHLFATEWDDPRKLMLNHNEHSIVVAGAISEEFISKMVAMRDEYYVVKDYMVKKEGGFNAVIIPVNKLNLYGSAIGYFRNKMIDSVLTDL